MEIPHGQNPEIAEVSAFGGQVLWINLEGGVIHRAVGNL